MSTQLGILTVVLGVDTSKLTLASSAMLSWEKKTTTSINSVSQRFRTFGYLASAALTLPIVMAGKAVFNLAKNYEYSMQKIVGLTGTSQEVVNEWSKELLKLSVQLGKSPQELAEGLYFISSSGIKGAEAMRVLELSAKAAASGLGETQNVADFLTSALNAYQGTGLTAAYATDILVAAVRVGKAEATGFASAMGQIIPIASQMGVSLDQVAGGMAAITLSGASASNAAVYLKGVFNALLKGGDIGKGAIALKSMNTSYEELRRILKEQGLIVLMQKLNDMSAQYGDTLYSKVFPNIRATLGVLSIAGKNFKYNTKIMQEVTDSVGSLGSAWFAVSNTIKIKYDQAIAAANVSMITLGKSIATSVLPILTWLVKKLEELTKWFDSLTEAQKRHKLIWIGIVAVLGPFFMMLSIIGYSISGIIAIVTKLGAAFIFMGKTVLTAIRNIHLYNVAITESMTLDSKITTALISPWALLTIAIGGAIIAAAKYGKKLGEIPKTLQELHESFKGMKGQESGINDQLSMMFAMDNNQIQNLKNSLEQRLQILKDDRIKLMAYRDHWFEEDKKYLRLQANLLFDVNAYNKWIKKSPGSSTTSYFAKEVQKDKEMIKAYVNDYENSLIKSTDIYNNKIAGTEEALKKVNKALNTQTAGIDSVLKKQEEYNKHLEDYLKVTEKIGEFKDELDYLSTLEKTMNSLGLTYDATEDKVQTLTEYLKYLVKEGYDPAGKEIQTVVNKLKELNSVLAEQRINDEWAEASAKTWEKKWKAMIPPLGYNTNLKIKTPGQMMGVAPTLPGGGFMPSIPKEDIEEANRQMERAKALASELTKVFTNMFETMGEGWQSVVDSIIQGIKRLVAVVMARLVVFGILSMLSGGTGKLAMSVGKLIKGGFWDFMLEPLGRGLSKGASGGIVPPGFSNDTYPALLSSGEKVIPAGIGHADTIRLEVDTIRVAGKDLAIVLRRAGQYN